MTARRDLYAALMAGGSHSPDRSDTASARIDAFRAEVLNEAADKLALALTADGHSLPGYPLAVRSAVRELRRMTDEAVAS
jgi:hypothetical protein